MFTDDTEIELPLKHFDLILDSAIEAMRLLDSPNLVARYLTEGVAEVLIRTRMRCPGTMIQQVFMCKCLRIS